MTQNNFINAERLKIEFISLNGSLNILIHQAVNQTETKYNNVVSKKLHFIFFFT